MQDTVKASVFQLPVNAASKRKNSFLLLFLYSTHISRVRFLAIIEEALTRLSVYEKPPGLPCFRSQTKALRQGSQARRRLIKNILGVNG